MMQNGKYERLFLPSFKLWNETLEWILSGDWPLPFIEWYFLVLGSVREVKRLWVLVLW